MFVLLTQQMLNQSLAARYYRFIAGSADFFGFDASAFYNVTHLLSQQP
jgi:hypothetical protein